MFARDDYSNYAQESSLQEWQEREESAERRQAAIRRHRAQLESDELYPECPNCSGHGQPLYATGSIDTGTGYADDETRCSLCAGSLS